MKLPFPESHDWPSLPSVIHSDWLALVLQGFQAEVFLSFFLSHSFLILRTFQLKMNLTSSAGQVYYVLYHGLLAVSMEDL